MKRIILVLGKFCTGYNAKTADCTKKYTFTFTLLWYNNIAFESRSGSPVNNTSRIYDSPSTTTLT